LALRLLYLTDRLSVRGGADQHLAQVVAAAVEAGHDVAVAFGRDEGGFELDRGVEVVRVRGLESIVDSSARLGELAGLLASADVVHVQNVMNPTVLAAACATGRAVVTVQDHRFLCPGPGKTLPDGSRCSTPPADAECSICLSDVEYRRRMLDLTAARLRAIRETEVLVLSRYMADELNRVGVAGAQVVPPWFEVGPSKDGPGSCFLVGGRLVRHKGVLDAWRAWRLAGSPLPLAVAGSGPLESDLDGATLHGWLDRRALRCELRRARALLFPGRWQEPFGILGVEALAQGTPVIVMKSGGTDEWSGAGCLRVAQGDVGAMASAAERLAADPGFARELGNEGRESVRRRFRRDRVEPAVLAVYDRLAARNT
jgi:glycosyltransferase involved in cell wall biosynthesis